MPTAAWRWSGAGSTSYAGVTAPKSAARRPAMIDTKVLAGKLALVTGASRGIGLAAAQALAQAGANVILAARASDRDRHSQLLERVV